MSEKCEICKIQAVIKKLCYRLSMLFSFRAVLRILIDMNFIVEI